MFRKFVPGEWRWIYTMIKKVSYVPSLYNYAIRIGPGVSNPITVSKQHGKCLLFRIVTYSGDVRAR